MADNCLISSFYIKPQPPSPSSAPPTIVLYRLSTSNHNLECDFAIIDEIVLYRLSTSNHNCLHDAISFLPLSYIVFLHQTTTVTILLLRLFLLSYIVFLHQTTTCRLYLLNNHILSYIVFLHQTTTASQYICLVKLLSYIVFLHQTTTISFIDLRSKPLSYIVFLHQTTTGHEGLPLLYDCLISSFYIKPQPSLIAFSVHHIVLYRLSTSNHNSQSSCSSVKSLSYIVFLHQTTTAHQHRDRIRRLSYIVFLHQTTTVRSYSRIRTYCLISSFYIKPQLVQGRSP